jgi:hypothetical protein
LLVSQAQQLLATQVLRVLHLQSDRSELIGLPPGSKLNVL